jgi:hypothetical protein
MSTPVDVFPDAEAAVGSIIRSDLSARVYSSIPKRPTYPLILVRRIGGVPITRHRLDAADIQLDVYGTTKSEARLLAVQARQSLYEAEGSTISISSGNAWYSGVTDVQGLTWLPDSSNVPLNRYVFTVRVFLHSA